MKAAGLRSDGEPPLPPLGLAMDFLRRLWALDHALQRHSRRQSQARGVTGPQRMVLGLVGRFPGITAQRLARLLELHPSTVTCIVKGLERRRLISRVADPKDARRMFIGLTTAGRDLSSGVDGVESAVEAVLAGLPAPELENVSETLSRLAASLDPSERRPPPPGGSRRRRR
jgi:MarR family transcriptional regulator, organic hydroperoxide resistance regulator